MSCLTSEGCRILGLYPVESAHVFLFSKLRAYSNKLPIFWYIDEEYGFSIENKA